MMGEPWWAKLVRDVACVVALSLLTWGAIASCLRWVDG